MDPGIRTPRAPTGPPCILVVDDDAAIRTTVAEILGEVGHEPFLAADGATA
jgi:CheY-like chemotaxis protein